MSDFNNDYNKNDSNNSGGNAYPANSQNSSAGGASAWSGENKTGSPASGAYAQNPQTTQTANSYGQTGSYTWNTAHPQGSPNPYYGGMPPMKPKKPKSPKKRTGVKIVAAVLGCLLISASSVGGFAYLINQGVVNVSSGERSDNMAAFTINKVIRQETEASNASSTINQLTPEDIAEKVIPSVVCIQSFQKESQNQFNLGGGNGLFGGTLPNQGGSDENDLLEPVSQGSGIIYNQEGYVITNAHVVEGDYNFKVITHDGQTYEAELVGLDTATDLAVLRIKADGATFTPAEFGSSEDLKVADQVMAIGNPGGIALNSTVTMGYVSALNREVTDPSQNAYALKYIQTDAAINPGNSGGALVNLYGQVIGINTAKVNQSGYEGLGFSIPIDDAQPIVSDLMQYGYVKDRAMIGITYQYVDEITARFNGLDATGLFVYSLTTDNAKASGLAWGDLITSIDGTEITSASTVTSVLAQKKPGDTVSLGIVRPSTHEQKTITVTLSENTGESASPAGE